MLDLLVSLLTGNVGASLRRYVRVAAFAALTLIFLFVAIAAAAVALFVTLGDAFGPVRAALIVAASALVLAGLVSIPLWLKLKPPPPSTASTLLELALAVGLGLLAGRGEKKERR